MTDNEIIENLKLHNGYGLIDQTLKLIYRQKAEIERLEKELDTETNHNDRLYKKIDRLQARNVELNTLNKTVAIEAIKEFAERLKESPSVTNCENEWLYLDIDNLVKEMVGD